jgi:hypothetical protein
MCQSLRGSSQNRKKLYIIRDNNAAFLTIVNYGGMVKVSVQRAKNIRLPYYGSMDNGIICRIRRYYPESWAGKNQLTYIPRSNIAQIFVYLIICNVRQSSYAAIGKHSLQFVK